MGGRNTINQGSSKADVAASLGKGRRDPSGVDVTFLFKISGRSSQFVFDFSPKHLRIASPFVHVQLTAKHARCTHGKTSLVTSVQNDAITFGEG